MNINIIEFQVLAIIHKEGEVYSSDILSKSQQAGLLLVEGTLYPLMSRLRRKKWVEYKWKESKSGPPRKYYLLTNLGEEAYQTKLKKWKKLVKTINKFLG